MKTNVLLLGFALVLAGDLASPAGMLLDITDECAPASGLVLSGDTVPQSVAASQLLTRTLVVSNSVTYSFQNVVLSGTLPAQTPLVAASAVNATGNWSSFAFSFYPTGCFPFSVTLTVTSSVTGTFTGTSAVSNYQTLHAGASLENQVTPQELSIADALVAEGDAGSTDLDFLVSLNAPAVGTVTVDFATTNGTATAGSDYTATNGTLTFATGESSKLIRVTASGDTEDEPDESLDVVLTNPSGAVLARAVGTGLILSDDGPQPPALGLPIPDQNGGYGQPFTYSFPVGTFVDPNPGQTLSYTASGLPPEISFDGLTRTFSGTPTNVGTYTITVTATDDGSPPLGTNDVFDLVIGKAPLTVTADNKSRIYGDINPPLTLSYTGFVLGENEAVLDSAPMASTTAETNSPVGNYDIPLSNGSDDHYSLTLSNGTLAVTPATLTATIDNTNRLCGQTNPLLTGTLVGVVNGDNIGVTFTSPATDGSALGDYPILPVFSDPDTKLGNYSIVTNGGTLTLLPEAITLEPATLPGGMLGVAYSQSLTATGGTAPYTIMLASGALPSELSLSTAGLLSGTPGTNGVYALSIAASDVHGCAASNGYSLTILPLPRLTILRAGTSVVLSWSTNYSEFQLLCATDLTAAPWFTATPPAVVLGNQLVVTNTVGAVVNYYRLQNP